MIPSVYTDLFNKLFDKTLTGEIDWEPTIEDSRYLASFPPYSLSVLYYQEQGGDWAEVVRFALYNEKGERIDDFSISDSQNKLDFDRAYELYAAARRRALKIDEAISVISEQLDAAGTVGFAEDEFIPEIEDDEIPK
jgi:hypothetical protein